MANNPEFKDFKRVLDSRRTKWTSNTISYEQDEQLLSDKEARRQRHSYFKFRQPQCHDDIAGDSWDSMHLDSFLQRSPFVADRFSTPRRTTLCNFTGKPNKSEHYFRTTLQNKNTSHIGWSPDNPMVSTVSVLPGGAQTVRDRLRIDHPKQPKDYSQYKYVSQEVKFQKTNPVTFQQVDLEAKPHENYRKLRLKNLIEKRYPKGMLGVDHPAQPDSSFYRPISKTLSVRQEPHTDSSYVIDAAWQSKKRAAPIIEPYKQPILFDPNTSQRRFRNVSSRPYNILTNRY